MFKKKDETCEAVWVSRGCGGETETMKFGGFSERQSLYWLTGRRAASLNLGWPADAAVITPDPHWSEWVTAILLNTHQLLFVKTSLDGQQTAEDDWQTLMLPFFFNHYDITR